MSADGNLKATSMPHPPTIHHKPAEPKCALCKLSLRGSPPVLLKSGKSVHVECYYRLVRDSGSEKTSLA